MFLKNCWYVAAWDHELIDGKMLARTLLEEPVLLYKAARNDKAMKLEALKGWVGRQEGHVRSRQSHDGDGLGSLGEAGGDRRGWARRGRRGACRPAGRGARVGCALSHREARRLTLIEARHRQDGQPHHDDQATCDRGSL